MEEFDRALAAIEKNEMPQVDRAARLIADRLLQGNHLYIHDDTGALTSEALGRAGGLMLIRGLPGEDLNHQDLKAGDVLILGARQAESPSLAALADRARQKGLTVIAIAPKGGLSDRADIALNDHAPANGGVVSVQGVTARIGPITGMTNAVLLWSLTAGLIEALLERGHKPHIWKSIKLKGAKEFNERALAETAKTGI